MVDCKYCGEGRVIKKGKRKLKDGWKQIYFCKDCQRKFSLGLDKKHYNSQKSRILCFPTDEYVFVIS